MNWKRGKIPFQFAQDKGGDAKEKRVFLRDQNRKRKKDRMKYTSLPDEFNTLNEMQKQAVSTVEGPLLILAGAGSGKTTVIVNRILYMIRYREIQPWHILAITFTNKAANELKTRLERLLGPAALELQASTFHSACNRILRRDAAALGYDSSFTIYDTDDSIKLMNEIVKGMNLDEKMFPAKGVLAYISSQKDQLKSPEAAYGEVGEDFRKKKMAQLYEEYQRRLKQSNAMDFDDMIYNTVRLLEKEPEVLRKYQERFRYIMVDEYQDTNHAQYRLVSLLAARYGNLCVVGDDDQSIYKFRGATVDNILSFEKQFEDCKVIKLEENYRSTGTILDAANRVIAQNTLRKGKTLWTKAESGSKIIFFKGFNDFEEGTFVADSIFEHVREGAKFSDHAVLYRMNAQSNSIEKALIKSGIPYRIFGGLKFYSRKEIKDMVAYLTLIANRGDTLRLKRVINEPKRGIGDATVELCEQLAAAQSLRVFDVMRNAVEYPQLGRKSTALMAFCDMINELEDIFFSNSLGESFDYMLEKTGYLSYLEAQGREGKDRYDNVMEFKSNIVKFEEENPEADLAMFLQEIALYTDLDELSDDADYVVLMTMHAAKGLEFPYVFIVGMEESIFPSAQAAAFPEEIEEERRLAYVAITRAKERLFITNSATRMLYGSTRYNPPSRFFEEIPKELVEMKNKTVRKISPTSGKGSFASPRKTAGSSHPLEMAGMSGKPTAKDTKEYRIGDVVRHKVFGKGMILSVSPMGNDRLLEIAFDQVGTKKIMANYANITKEN